MRLRTLAAFVGVAAVAALSACSSGDDDSDAGEDATSATTAAPATVPADISTTIPLPRTSTTECEDIPDPADYPEGEIPQALRPCTIPTELAVHTIRTGIGREAQNGDTLIVDFTGVRSETGEMFDSTYLRGIPDDFVLGGGDVISGWEQAFPGAQAGAVLKLDVPPDLAYANAPPGDAIEAGDTLTYVVELRAVIPPLTEADAPLDLVVDRSEGATTLGIVDVTVGDGATIEEGDTAVLHMLLVRGDNLVVMLDTWKRRDPLQVIMAEDQTLPGMFDGLLGAKVGGTRVLTLPPDLAFGPQGEAGLGLPAGVDLIVVAEVLGVY